MVIRGEKKGPFKDDDIERLAVFAPEMARAYRAGQRARRAQELGRAAIDSLDAMPVGVAILNINGGVVAANRMAAQVIEAGSWPCRQRRPGDRSWRPTPEDERYCRPRHR